jgi:predicted esterase
LRTPSLSQRIVFLGAFSVAIASCSSRSDGGAESVGSAGRVAGGGASGGAAVGASSGAPGQAMAGGATSHAGEPGSAGAGSSMGGAGFGNQAGGASGNAGQKSSGGQGATDVAGSASTGGAAGRGGTGGQRSIAFGTLLDAQTVTATAQQQAKTLGDSSSAQWQAKGDQHRTYRFAAANESEPYRLYVPTNWDGKTKLPLAMFLHGSGADENTYVDQNGKQLLSLAQQHGYLLVAPLGDKGAYGNFLRLTSPFGKPDEAAKLVAQITADTERTNELSEQDVINVLELVLAEYPIDRGAMFLFGHSMGSGGTWYLGGKYPSYWRGIAPMSGPFVQETGYPWDDLRNTLLFVSEGTQAPSVDASHTLRDWLKSNGFKSEYDEVNADHGGMVSLVLPAIFDFFDRSRAK